MPLQSRLFKDDRKLQNCLERDEWHVVPGARGDHVGRIQRALITLGAGVIDFRELTDKRYGETTASTVLRFKGPPRNITHARTARCGRLIHRKDISATSRPPDRCSA